MEYGKDRKIAELNKIFLNSPQNKEGLPLIRHIAKIRDKITDKEFKQLMYDIHATRFAIFESLVSSINLKIEFARLHEDLQAQPLRFEVFEDLEEIL